MKRILLTVFVLSFFSVKAQQEEETRRGYFVNLNPNPKGQVWVGIESGDVKIEGDTIEAIKHLTEFIEQLQAENEEYFKCIDASVKWHNNVSDYFKKGKEYQTYQRLLKKNGYKTNVKK